MGTHYSLGQSPAEMKKWALNSAIALHDMCEQIYKNDFAHPILCYSGMSGISHATALALAYYNQYNTEAQMIYVRKRDEDSHGSRVERSLNLDNKKNVLVFVDDFVASGRTERYTLNNAIEWIDNCSGGVIYNKQHYIRASSASYENVVEISKHSIRSLNNV